MSVFVEDMIVSRMGRKSKKKYSTKYNPKYREDFPWALPSAKGDTFAFCHFCQVDICIRSVGAKGLRDHALTCRHSHKCQAGATATILENDVMPEKNALQNFNIDQPLSTVTHSYQNLCQNSSQITGNTHVSDRNQLPSSGHISIGRQIQPNQLSVESLKIQEQINHYEFSLQEPNSRYTTLPMDENLGSAVVHVNNTSSAHSLVSQSPHSSSINNALYSVVDEDCTTLQTIYPYPPQIDTPLELHRNEHSQLSCEKTPQNISRHDMNTKTSQDVLDPSNGMYQSSQSSYESGSSSSHLDKSGGLSIDDLTCNVCGTVFDNWMDLKNDLLLHIKHAQEQPERKNRNKKHAKLPKRTVFVESDTDMSYPRRKGRPPGTKKKTITDMNPDMESASVHNISSQKTDHSMDQTLSSEDYYVHQANTATASLLPAVQEIQQISQQEAEVDLSPTQKSSKKSNSFSCRVCQAIFTSRPLLKDHMKLAHNNGRPFECDVCNKFFTKKSNLEVHKKHKHCGAQNSCECNTCGKVLSTRTNLRIHLRIHEGKKPFACKVCTKRFNRKANLEMHVVYHTGERRFTCEMCGKSFFAINALKRHRKLHTGERDYGCKICAATYVTATDLRRHMLKHNDIKPFPCNLCEKQFTRSHDLKVHLRYHNKDHQFTCPDCKKKFVESGNYRRHLRRHTGERPYTCSHCFQTFTQVHHYKVHLQNQHKDGEDCEKNSTRFSDKSKTNTMIPVADTTSQCMDLHPTGSIPTICQIPTNTRYPIIQSPSQQHTMTNAVHTMHGPVNHITHPGSNQGSSQINPPPGGVVHQYNYVYNSSVVPHYHTIFDVCPHSQQQ